LKVSVSAFLSDLLTCIELAAAGIGAHNAGLSLEDRRAVEELFLNKILRVVVATSTLAVGVNLRPHILPFFLQTEKSCVSQPLI
jgi:superfamily II RNA helicase